MAVPEGSEAGVRLALFPPYPTLEKTDGFRSGGETEAPNPSTVRSPDRCCFPIVCKKLLTKR